MKTTEVILRCDMCGQLLNRFAETSSLTKAVVFRLEIETHDKKIDPPQGFLDKCYLD